MRVRAAVFVALTALVGGVACTAEPVGPPIEEGEPERYRYVAGDSPPELFTRVSEVLEVPFSEMVVAPSARRANQTVPTRQDWDQTFFDYTVHSVIRHHGSRLFWVRLETIWERYAETVEALNASRLPPVFAAIPYHRTGFRKVERGPACGAGPWLLTPEQGQLSGMSLGPCKIRGRDDLWHPNRRTAYHDKVGEAPYIEPRSGRCNLMACANDDRMRFDSANERAVALLERIWRDGEVAASGAAIQLSILAISTGLDDNKIDMEGPRGRNILPLIRRWMVATGKDGAEKFYGLHLSCRDEKVVNANSSEQRCARHVMPRVQHELYNIVAEHLLAVCYYVGSHPEAPAFEAWSKYGSHSGYCSGLTIPDRATVESWKP